MDQFCVKYSNILVCIYDHFWDQAPDPEEVPTVVNCAIESIYNKSIISILYIQYLEQHGMEAEIQLPLKRFPDSSVFPNLQLVDARKGNRYYPVTKNSLKYPWMEVTGPLVVNSRWRLVVNPGSYVQP